MSKTKYKSGDWMGRVALYLLDGGGTGRESTSVPKNPDIQMDVVQSAEEMNCACKIITVPPLTWGGGDDAYIVTQFGQSQMKWIKRKS